MGDQYRAFLVSVELADIFDNGFKWFLDYISDSTGYPGLSDVDYEIVEARDGTLIFKVSGDVSRCEGRSESIAIDVDDLPLDQLVGAFYRRMP